MTTQPNPSEQPGPELLPCPWCGITPTVERGAGYDYRVECRTETCVVTPETVGIRGQKNAISAWNHRTDLAQAPATSVPTNALIQLLDAALTHPESAEGNIRRVIEELSTTAPSPTTVIADITRNAAECAEEIGRHLVLGGVCEAALRETAEIITRYFASATVSPAAIAVVRGYRDELQQKKDAETNRLEQGIYVAYIDAANEILARLEAIEAPSR